MGVEAAVKEVLLDENERPAAEPAQLPEGEGRSWAEHRLIDLVGPCRPVPEP